jgi:hypothetical protein
MELKQFKGQFLFFGVGAIAKDAVAYYEASHGGSEGVVPHFSFI